MSPHENPAPSVPASVVARLRAAGCVFAEEEAALLLRAARTPAELEALVERRTAGHPLEQVVGWAEFLGLRLVLEPGVFVPRRRTEFLARQAAALLGAAGPAPVALDLCCGSGAVAAALAAAVPAAEVHAADLDPAAVRCARRNLGARVYEGDLFEALPAALCGRIDVLVANVPYVPTGEIPLLPPEARDHEPAHALDGGPDGLALLRRVAAGAPAWLTPGGSLLSETTQRQTPAALAALTAAGLKATPATDPDLDATILIATAPRAGRSAP
ncbi:putative protein N(5)-glutamine methyltransferase [Streptomyces sp. DSM 44917]|uniref:Methyltransferase domain-containing protein n=1 Tax=Streptomyces boetiae TaxID=3075541 RepID=A0ABU2L324_9ACTN|nr:putative protein N(5)-glutamine methyltransferase [Streptomyces sp. DSM 44917]MDT0305767.1 putative protein N(5)-glutamine methyltransferase [Streptomyces sp. DSM 44917]